VRFLGKIRVIEKMLAISDVFVLPSETESFGLVALEAMASETAVISTNSGGISEVNIEGKTGFLSSVGDVDKMAEDTITLLKDRELLKSFKINALAHAKSFSIQDVLPKYNAIYLGLCYIKKNR
jgi:glycosyltransferase involved in cell wall biosynthesis